MARPPDGIVAPPGLLTRPAAVPLSTVAEPSRITRPQPRPQPEWLPLPVRCGRAARSHGLHLVPRSLGGCGDPLCVVPLCRGCHRAYDRGELDLLPYLEPGWRAQLAHAVAHLGLIGALRQVSGHWDRAGQTGRSSGER